MNLADRKELKRKIQSREIDINNTQSYFSALIKGFMWDINRHLKIRGELIPHIIVNTGDDTMYLNVKGYNHAKEPKEVTNEDYVYNMVPRATIQVNGINMQTDQLTAPYAWGEFNLETPDEVLNMRGEFRRMPLKMTIAVKYYLDDFTDLLECTQQIITNLAFIKDYTITYMGQTVNCTYRVPDALQGELMLEFDGVTTDSKSRTVEVEYEVESNIPVYNERTVMFTDEMIAYPTGVQHFKKIPERTKEQTQELIDETVRMRDQAGYSARGN